MENTDWEIRYIPDAEKDIMRLDRTQQVQVLKALRKVRMNPLPTSSGSYGKPLGNRHGRNLTGLLKIKLKSLGLRVVYKLIHSENTMLILVIAARSDLEVYAQAEERLNTLN